MYFGLPPMKEQQYDGSEMVEAFLSKRTDTQSKEAVELAKAKEKLKTLSVGQLVKMMGHTKNYCYRLKRGDEPMSQKLIKKLGA